jgi:hydroxymethylpyrimidine pyrophosphatase-like HAD family hydrolase
MIDARPQGLAMVVTDLDGTLTRADHTVTPRNRQTLHRLGRHGIVRTIATGRSLHAARLVLDPEFPIDFLICSTGAGILDWHTQTLLWHRTLTADEVVTGAQRLHALGLDFMVHHPLPHSHRFSFHRTKKPDPDFERRLRLYDGHCEPISSFANLGPACQFLAIAPPGDPRLDIVRREMPRQTVIRTTSPLDGASTWIEVFPAGVSKSTAAAWLCAHRQISPTTVLGIGNDFNDLDLLAWARYSFVVANAPPALRHDFPVTADTHDDGFSRAVAEVLHRVGLDIP